MEKLPRVMMNNYAWHLAAILIPGMTPKNKTKCIPICLIGPYDLLIHSVKLTELHIALRRSGSLPDCPRFRSRATEAV